MDFASGQSLYIQKFDATENVAEVSEETLFQTCIVPLKLQVGENDIWNNEKPNSTHFCRPVHIQFKKESATQTQYIHHNQVHFHSPLPSHWLEMIQFLEWNPNRPCPRTGLLMSDRNPDLFPEA